VANSPFALRSAALSYTKYRDGTVRAFHETDIIHNCFIERATMNEHEKNKLMELCGQIINEQAPRNSLR
jgi:hypothetical protein